MSLPLRVLGKTGAKIPFWMYGTGLSISYGKPPNEQESINVLNRAIELGCNFWDTANVYGNNEVLLSKVLKKRRNEAFLCTKFGMVADKTGIIGVSGEPEYVRQSCELSLTRLGVDYIDQFITQ